MALNLKKWNRQIQQKICEREYSLAEEQKRLDLLQKQIDRCNLYLRTSHGDVYFLKKKVLAISAKFSVLRFMEDLREEIKQLNSQTLSCY